MLYYVILCYTMLYYVVLCCTMLYYNQIALHICMIFTFTCFCRNTFHSPSWSPAVWRLEVVAPPIIKGTYGSSVPQCSTK